MATEPWPIQWNMPELVIPLGFLSEERYEELMQHIYAGMCVPAELFAGRALEVADECVLVDLPVLGLGHERGPGATGIALPRT